MENDPKFGKGLLPLPIDNRDLSHVAVFGALRESQLPTEDFVVAEPLKIKNQADLDFCSGFGITEVSEDQEGVELDPLWQFAHIKKVLGDWKPWGADLRSAGLSLVNYGSIPQSKAPFTIDESRDFLANWENYPKELEYLARDYRKGSMFFVDGPHDIFDNIRMTLWKNRAEKRSVLVGALWHRDWNTMPGGVISKFYVENGAEGHCFKVFGQKTIDGELYLVAQNSWGKNIGDNGIFYFPREVVNKEFAPFGQITFKDMTVESARWYMQNGLKVSDWAVWNVVKSVVSAFWDFITNRKTS